MKKIGLLGGMSWESSAEYYRLINADVAQRLGGLHSARCVLASVDFAEIERLQAAGEWDAAGVLLAREASALEAAGAEVVVLCTNTMHLVAHHITDAITVPLLDLIDVVADALERANHTRVGLLGTGFTMGSSLYRDRLAARGIEVLVPEDADRAEVHRVIYDELCRGIVVDASRRAYEAIVGRLAERGAQGVILGCTEIELLLRDNVVAGLSAYPTTRLHARAAVDAALDGELTD